MIRSGRGNERCELKRGLELDADSLRYHAVGNSVTPAVAEWLGGRIADYLSVGVSAPKVGEKLYAYR